MSRNSFICDVHSQEATQFCLCGPNPLFICAACLPKHKNHESYPIAQSALFQAIGRDREELKRRNVVSRNSQAFLERVIAREAAVQTEARALINALHQNYEMWLEGNHRSFETVITTLREETALLLTQPKCRVSSITQLLLNKQDLADSTDEVRFTSIPELETLTHLLEHSQDVCSRAPGVWQEDYKEEVLQAFTKVKHVQKAEAAPENLRDQQTISVLQARLQKWGITADPPTDFQEPDYSTPQSRAALAKYGPYSNQDDELVLFKRAPVTEDTGVYIGQWNSRGQKHGYGKYLWKDGNIYEGQWRNGQKTGRGRFIWASSGNIYVGDFVQNKMEGFGTYYFASGSEYSGAWVNDEYNGVGSDKCGEGAFQGHRYIGEFLDGKKDGIGAYFWADGAMHVGSWKADKRHGKGVYAWADGRMYFGDFEDGDFSGTCCYVYTNGDVYRGQWKQDKKNGPGRLTHPGAIEEGTWVNDALSGKGR